MKKHTALQILHLALPLILQQLCLQLQVWIDRAMLGHLNAVYFSAIGNTLVPYQMVVSTILAICGGTTILVAQGSGAGDEAAVRKAAESSFLGSSLLALTGFACFFLCSDGLFRIMGVHGEVLDYCNAYLRILSLSLLFLGPSGTANAVLQGLGYTRIIMVTGILGNVLNIVLDWLLIFGTLGFPAWGIRGAAAATVIANALSAVLVVGFVLVSPRMPVTLKPFRSPGQQLRHYRRVLILGIPSGLEFLLWNTANLILVSFLNRLDMLSAGIYTLVFSIESIPLLIYMGFANAGLTLVGQETGARSPRQARQTGLLCLAFSLAVCFVVAVIFHAIPRQLLGMFTDDAEILRISTPYLVFVSYIFFPKAINAVIGLCIRGMGDTRWMLYTQIFGTFFMIGCGYYLILCTGLGLSGIFVTLLLDESLRGGANLLHFFSLSCKMERM